MIEYLEDYMNWHTPLPFLLTEDPDDTTWQDHMTWLQSDYGNSTCTPPTSLGLPLGNHPGAFARIRKNHIHEGVDLYVANRTPIMAVEKGVIVAIENFTGKSAGSPWWQETQAVLIEGKSGVVLLGEIELNPTLKLGQSVEAGEVLGVVKPVLSIFKGRPMSMLHLELHEHGVRESKSWNIDSPKPLSLKDPTPYLRTLVLINHSKKSRTLNEPRI